MVIPHLNGWSSGGCLAFYSGQQLPSCLGDAAAVRYSYVGLMGGRIRKVWVRNWLPPGNHLRPLTSQLTTKRTLQELQAAGK